MMNHVFRILIKNHCLFCSDFWEANGPVSGFWKLKLQMLEQCFVKDYVRVGKHRISFIFIGCLKCQIQGPLYQKLNIQECIVSLQEVEPLLNVHLHGSQIYTKFRAPTCSLFPVTSISVKERNIYSSIMEVTVFINPISNNIADAVLK